MSTRFDERVFCDVITLAFQYDTTDKSIIKVVKDLQAKGYDIETMRFGGDRRIKVNQKQLKVALLKEFGEKL